MASLSHEDGRRIIYTSGPKRPKISLGRIPKKQAESILRHVEALEAAAIDRSVPPRATAEWLAVVDAKLRGRMAKLGLCSAPGEGRTTTLGELLDSYKAQKFSQYKPGTIQVHDCAFRSIGTHWGMDRQIATLSAGDAEAFRDNMLAEGLAEATVRKRCRIASKLMRYAIKRGIIDRNPFDDADVPRSDVGSAHKRFISSADAAKVQANLPSLQWRLLFALSRWGGLRVGSEPRLLTWASVDWEQRRLVVPSPKTERYAGRAVRVIPFFPELAELLSERFEEAAPGEELILPFLHGRTDASLRKTLVRAIKQAGFEVWPRLWHNMRASRQTELEREFPNHVVCNWLGNTRGTAEKHYLMVTDDDFDRGQKWGQNRGQSVPAESELELQRVREPHEAEPAKPVVLQSLTTDCNSFASDSISDSIAREGLEPPTKEL